ncbi:MAG: hypothetical protein IT355_17230 [Gemmatimonadaceae bacterium]|nr:hypothetical protein [Gemmatimonadaceae bacterium]
MPSSSRSTAFPASSASAAAAAIGMRQAAGTPLVRPIPAQQPAQVRPATPVITVAALFADTHLPPLLASVERLAHSLGVPLTSRTIPASLARAGQVGRIGLPGEAVNSLLQQGVLISANFGGDPLAPVARLVRGLQRRTDVVVDVRPMLTLPGSPAAAEGWERDVLLFSHRTLERHPAVARSREADVAQARTRARDAAGLAYRLCTSESRKLVVVLPVGRGTRAQQGFVEALQQQAATAGLTPPRIVKAGLLTALLSGESGRERWLVASVIPIDELSAMIGESLGAVVPWPVLSYGRGASFYDLPVPCATEDPVPLLLVLVSLLQRSGRGELAQQLQAAVLMTCGARNRMAEELGVPLRVPFDAFVQGVVTNLGRAPFAPSTRDRRRAERAPQTVAGPVHDRLPAQPNRRERAARAMAVTAGCSMRRSAEMA